MYYGISHCSGSTGLAERQVLGCAGEGDSAHGVPGLWAEGLRV